LRFLQRQQLTGFGWDVLLKSQNLNELLDRRRQVKLVYQADQQILTSLNAEAERINQQKTEIELQKNQIALLTQQLLAQKAQFQAQA
jgi:peptidoglycan hydrolase CwlO-like protein